MLSLIDSSSDKSDGEESPKFGKAQPKRQKDDIDDIINELDGKPKGKKDGRLSKVLEESSE